MLEEKIKAREIMYGINTGIGEFSEVVLTDEQVKEFQKYLIYNHAAGIGDPAPIEHVRAAMAGRINVHARGRSGCRPEITLTLSTCSTRASRPSSARRARSAPAATSPPCPRSPFSSWAKARPFTRASGSPAGWRWSGRASRFPASRPATGWPRSTARTSSPPSAPSSSTTSTAG